MMTISKFQHATTSPIYYRFQVLSKDVVKTKQLLVGASGTEEPVQLRSSQKKQGKLKRPRYSGDLNTIQSNTRSISNTTVKIPVFE